MRLNFIFLIYIHEYIFVLQNQYTFIWISLYYGHIAKIT